MNYTVFIDSDAKLDIQETIKWYNQQREGLGNEYYQDFKKVIDFLKEHPLAFRIRYMDTRQVQVGSRFPMFIHYIVNEKMKTINIFGVLHGGREPEIWKVRLKV